MNATLRAQPVVGEAVWRHKKFGAAFERVKALATFAPPGSMILVVGASGAGKTTLLQQLQKHVAGPVETWPKGLIPIAATPICNDVQGFFNSKNLVMRLLAAVEHPFYGVHQQTLFPPRPKAKTGLDRVRLNYSEPHLRLALERAIEYRETKYIFLDEAQHLMKTGSDEKAVNNLDCLKGLAGRTGAIVILFGTFDILTIWNRSAQLNRRLYDVVLHRYFKENQDDVNEFLRILESFSRTLPMPKGMALRHVAEFIYESTMGIIGEVARLLVDAYAHMIASGAETITESMLRDAAHSPAKLATLRMELAGGEAMLSGHPVTTNQLLNLKVRVRAKGRPGRRNPSRDPVPTIHDRN